MVPLLTLLYVVLFSILNISTALELIGRRTVGSLGALYWLISVLQLLCATVYFESRLLYLCVPHILLT